MSTLPSEAKTQSSKAQSSKGLNEPQGRAAVRTTWAIPFHEGGPDVLFVVDSDHKFSLKEMVEYTWAARKLEDQQREAVKGGVRHV
jgi:hypothetical protein